MSNTNGHKLKTLIKVVMVSSLTLENDSF
jgi:hypothetical protein